MFPNLTRMRVALLITLVAVATGTGCGRKKSLDTTTDALLEALRTNDYAAFEKIAHPGLLTEVPKPKFEAMSKVVAKLGPLKDRTMKGISVATGKPDQGDYTLEFERGAVQLALRVADDSVVGFELTGETVTAVMKEVDSERYKELSVSDFLFVGDDQKPNPRGNIYKEGSTVHFQFVFAGLRAGEGGYQVKTVLILRTAVGEEIRRDVIVDETVPVKPDRPPLVDIHGSFPAAAKGTYRVELELSDAVQSKSITYSQSVVIK
ncbi:MAG: hypothetical protein IV100_22805 [Myxococcales bacterium]|nr:hypothetical protein [Myxococcales bacterium]